MIYTYMYICLYPSYQSKEDERFCYQTVCNDGDEEDVAEDHHQMFPGPVRDGSHHVEEIEVLMRLELEISIKVLTLD